jgi:hypothetical protein
MTLGAAASVPLVTDEAYEDNGHHIYQFVVISCMLFHLFFFETILIKWYQGVKLVRWSEKRRRDEWKYSMGSKLNYPGRTSSSSDLNELGADFTPPVLPRFWKNPGRAHPATIPIRPASLGETLFRHFCSLHGRHCNNSSTFHSI